jgi:hypothetical protein
MNYVEGWILILNSSCLAQDIAGKKLYRAYDYVNKPCLNSNLYG